MQVTLVMHGVLGTDKNRFRANDDGEPSNSAGKPILGQIEKNDLTNVLVAVARYFGGSKLGVGGLIDAYRSAAHLAIENAGIVKRQLLSHFRVHFRYERMSDVMLNFRIHSWEIENQDFQISCTIDFAMAPMLKLETELAFKPFDDVRLDYLGIW